MTLEPDVGCRDSIARAVLGFALIAAAGGPLVGGRAGGGLAATVLGAVLLCDAVTRFCGVDAMLGVDICSQE